MLTFLFKVVALEVIDNGYVVDVAAVWGDIPVLITIVILSKSSNKLSYAKNKNRVRPEFNFYLQTCLVGAFDSIDSELCTFFSSLTSFDLRLLFDLGFAVV